MFGSRRIDDETELKKDKAVRLVTSSRFFDFEKTHPKKKKSKLDGFPLELDESQVLK